MRKRRIIVSIHLMLKLVLKLAPKLALKLVLKLVLKIVLKIVFFAKVLWNKADTEIEVKLKGVSIHYGN